MGNGRIDMNLREKEKSGWDLLALKLFHLMVLRGIDGRKEGAQKSIKSEKGEIKSSPSHHLLKWSTLFFCHHCVFPPTVRTQTTLCDLFSSSYSFPHLPYFFLAYFPSLLSLLWCASINYLDPFYLPSSVSLSDPTTDPPQHQINGFIDIGEYHKATINGVAELEEPAVRGGEKVAEL